MKISAIIPARSGSKRIEGKNVKEISGKPIIVDLITKLIGSSLFGDVYVSTDSTHIADLAKKAGALTPFLRTSELSGDFVGTHEVILDCISRVSKSTDENDIFVCIYPTSILTEIPDLIKAIEICNSNPDSFVFAAHQPNSSPYRAFYREPTGNLKFLFPEYMNSRSQDLPECFVDSGQFYIAKQKTWISQSEILNPQSIIFEIPSSRALDLNTEDDWQVLEAIIESKKVNK